MERSLKTRVSSAFRLCGFFARRITPRSQDVDGKSPVPFGCVASSHSDAVTMYAHDGTSPVPFGCVASSHPARIGKRCTVKPGLQCLSAVWLLRTAIATNKWFTDIASPVPFGCVASSHAFEDCEFIFPSGRLQCLSAVWLLRTCWKTKSTILKLGLQCLSAVWLLRTEGRA